MSLPILSLLLHSVSPSPQVDCAIDNEECEVTDNLVHIYAGISSIQECMTLCHDDFDCIAFNYFGPESDFIPTMTCLLLSSCDTKIPCESCVRGAFQDDEKCLCSIGYVGAIDGNNLVDMVSDVQDEATCKQLCTTNDDCEVYTYHKNKTITEANMCFFLLNSGLKTEAEVCDNCVTGPSRCEAEKECKVAVFDIDGTALQRSLPKQV